MPDSKRRTHAHVPGGFGLHRARDRCSEVWSSALNGVRLALGAAQADKAILQAQFAFAVNTTMPAAARQTIATVNTLYGSKAASKATSAFHARGLA